MDSPYRFDAENLPRFRDPLTALLWGARGYVTHAISGEPTPAVLRLLFRQVLPADVEPVLVRTLDFLIYHSTVPLVVRQGRSAGFAAHEQALAEAIRAIQAGSLGTYCAAMEQVLVAEDAIKIGPSVQAIASAMQRLERDGFVQSASISMPAPFVGSGRLVSLH